MDHLERMLRAAMFDIPFGRSNNDLVDIVKKSATFTGFLDPFDSAVVLQAMRHVDRRDFLPDTPFRAETYDTFAPFVWQAYPKADEAPSQLSPREVAYVDGVLPIGDNQTCSQPSLVAYMAKTLRLQEGMRVLEVGTGCGYSAAIAARLVGERGHVVTVECRRDLYKLGVANLARHFGGEGIARHRVTVVHGNGKRGEPAHGPYDRIYFTAGVQDIAAFDRTSLAEQLTPNGLMLIPEHDGHLWLLRYENGAEKQMIPLLQVGFVLLQ